MIRRNLGSLVDIAIHEPTDENVIRWVRGLPPSDGRADPDIVWPASTSQTSRVGRDGSSVWRGGRSGSELLAVIQAALIERSATLLHAGAVEVAGSGVVVLGPSGSGKTLITLAALTRPNWKLLSDDLVVLRSNGTITALPTAITMRPHHMHLLPSDMQGTLQAHTRQSAAAARMARVPGTRWVARKLRDRLSASAGRFAAWSRTVKTDSITIEPQTIFDTERLTRNATVRLVVTLNPHTAGLGPTPDLEQIVRLAATDTYRNEHIGDVLRDLDTSGELELPDHMKRFDEVIRHAISPTTPIIPATTSPQDAITDTQRRLIHVIESCVDTL